MDIDITQLQDQFRRELNEVQTSAALSGLKAAYLGKKGSLRALTQNLKELSIEERKQLGRQSNQLKELFEKLLKDKQTELDQVQLKQKLNKEWFDFSLSEDYWEDKQFRGGLHPVSIVQQELEDIFLSMGFFDLGWSAY